jgi:PKD repeat protein
VKFSNWSLSDPLDTIISYEWDFDGDGNFDALDENPEHLYFASITPYTVSLIVTNNSGTKDTLTRQDYISVNSSISSLEDIGQIGQRNYIFPNPVNGSFDVRGMKELKSVIIQDLNGKKIVELKKENNDFQFSIPPLPSGLYLFELQSEKSRFVQKVLISD